MQQHRLIERVVLRPACKSPVTHQHPGRAGGGLIAREQGSPAARPCTSPISRFAAPTRTAGETARCGQHIVAKAVASSVARPGRKRPSAGARSRTAASGRYRAHDLTRVAVTLGIEASVRPAVLRNRNAGSWNLSEPGLRTGHRCALAGSRPTRSCPRDWSHYRTVAGRRSGVLGTTLPVASLSPNRRCTPGASTLRGRRYTVRTLGSVVVEQCGVSAPLRSKRRRDQRPGWLPLAEGTRRQSGLPFRGG